MRQSFIAILLLVTSVNSYAASAKTPSQPTAAKKQESVRRPASDEEVMFAEMAIRNYLTSRPNASDTAEGIHEFWIQWPEQAPPISVTLAALGRLEASGEVERFRAGTRLIWRSARNLPQ